MADYTGEQDNAGGSSTQQPGGASSLVPLDSKWMKPRSRRHFDTAEHKPLKGVEYYFENGKWRTNNDYQTFAKGRWLGRTIADVFYSEFQDRTKEYYKRAIETGAITVNGGIVPLNYIFRNADVLEHTIHRHEPPVSAEPVKIVHQEEEFIIVDKPSSIPIHPTGRYHHNSMLHILRHEHPELPELLPVNRIDRLTSGIAMVCLNKGSANQFMSELKERRVEKHYLARVRGEFPATEDFFEVDQPIKTVSHKLGVNVVDKDGKPCTTLFKRVNYNGLTSVVYCKPLTGRTHQIRVHLQYLGFPIANDPLYCTDFWGAELGKGGVSPDKAKEAVAGLEKAAFPHPNLEESEPAKSETAAARGEETGKGKGKRPAVDEMETPKRKVKIVDTGDVPSQRFFPEVEGCPDCGVIRADPTKEQLSLWLHSFVYEFESLFGGQGKVFETEFPPWAHPTFRGDRDLIERFWKHGGKWDGKNPGEILN
ncbi:RNA pseudouridylate synthase domain containing protein 2 [Borealophlyctis nickersoniae]|nr:RNA pseudouridylate synthase domain containing protein 2 [Borealophlyctis nickersoniae]